RRPSARAAARRARASARAAPLLLEEREVHRRVAGPRPRRAGVLGAERLSRPRRSLARAALPGRLMAAPAAPKMEWLPARVLSIRDETTRAKTFRLALPEPAPHRAGQHYIVRLTAPDGYTASRSYSVASPPDGSNEFDITVERLDNGEVSTF